MHIHEWNSEIYPTIHTTSWFGPLFLGLTSHHTHIYLHRFVPILYFHGWVTWVSLLRLIICSSVYSTGWTTMHTSSQMGPLCTVAHILMGGASFLGSSEHMFPWDGPRTFWVLRYVFMGGWTHFLGPTACTHF